MSAAVKRPRAWSRRILEGVLLVGAVVAMGCVLGVILVIEAVERSRVWLEPTP